MSVTWRWQASASRRPVARRVLRKVKSLGLWLAARKMARTSSGVRGVGGLMAVTLGLGTPAITSGRSRVWTKRNLSAAW